jgi:DNA polymerase III epsilon subunit-like protein
MARREECVAIVGRLDCLVEPMISPLDQRHVLLHGSTKSYVILDLETTGKITSGEFADEIVEIALLEVDCFGEIIFSWETTLKASKPSSPRAIAKHKLSHEALQGSPEFNDIGYWLATALNGKTLVAHNLHKFDGLMLADHFLRLPGINVDIGEGIDTLPLPSKGMGLDDLREAHFIKELAHSAMGDVRTILSLLQMGVLAPRPGLTPFLITKSPFENVEEPKAVTRRDLYRVLSGKQEDSGRDERPAMQPCDVIYLQPGAKVCLSGGEGAYRELLEKKHEELQLERKSIRSVSKGLAAIVVTDLYSAAAKPAKARDYGVPFVKAEDFLDARTGAPLKAWKYTED